MVGCLSVWFLIGRLSEFLIPQWSALSECLVPNWSDVCVSGYSLVGFLSVGSSLVSCLESLVPQWSALSECLLPHWSAVLSVWFLKCRLCLSVWFPIGRMSECLVPHWSDVWAVWFLIGRLSELSAFSWDPSGLLNLFLVCSPMGRCLNLFFYCLPFSVLFRFPP